MKNEKEKTPIESIMESAISHIKRSVETDNVIGTPVTTPEGITIIPLSKVSVGFIAGGGEHGELKKEDPNFSGGSGGGYCVSPMGFLVIQDGKVKVLNTSGKTTYEKILENMPGIIHSIGKSVGEMQDDKKKK